jgi:hypothetical protein
MLLMGRSATWLHRSSRGVTRESARAVDVLELRFSAGRSQFAGRHRSLPATLEIAASQPMHPRRPLSRRIPRRERKHLRLDTYRSDERALAIDR